MQIAQIENNTQHPITLAFRVDAKRTSAVGTKEFVDVQVVLKPGVSDLSEREAEAVRKLRAKSKTTAARFERMVQTDEGRKPELVLKTRNATRGELESHIRRCCDVPTLKRWRDQNNDKALAEIIEDQLAACTVTVDGDVTDPEVDRDPEDPKRGRKSARK